MNRPKICRKLQKWSSQVADLKLQIQKKLRLRNCGIAVAEQHFLKSCGIAITEVLPSSCGIAIADSKESCASPPLPVCCDQIILYIHSFLLYMCLFFHRFIFTLSSSLCIMQFLLFLCLSTLFLVFLRIQSSWCTVAPPPRSIDDRMHFRLARAWNETYRN